MTVFDNHDCKLQNDVDESIVNQIIDTGIFISTRRKLCELAIINKAHPQTQLYYKSTAACRKEEVRHILNYPLMSHPFCIWCLYWEFFIFWVYFYMYVSYIVRSCFSFGDTSVYYIKCARIVGDSVLLLDMIHLFFRGYYDTEKSRTVMKQSEVVKKYLLTYFLIDLVPAAPSVLFLVTAVGSIKVQKELSMSIQIIGMLRILRIGRWLDTIELFRQYMNFSSYLFKGIKTVLVYIIMMAYFVSILITILTVIDLFHFGMSSIRSQSKMLYSAMLVLLVVSYGDYLPDNAIAVTLAAFFLCIGFIMNLFLCAQILQVWNKFSRARDTNENLLRQFNEYMKYKGLPASLRRRIYTYFQFKYHNEFYSESQINSMISDLLKKEILKNVTKDYMERSKLFKNLPEPVMLAMISRLKSVIYLPDDVIVTAGKKGQTMFFIYYGTVAVYTAMGREVYHLEDGDNFGEMALVFNESATATVVAVTPCELFRLRRMDFLAVIDSYPDLKDKFMTTISNTSKSFCGHQQNNKIIMTVFDDHDCKLQHDVEESIVNQIIDTGIFINTRRKLCELAIINKAHPQTQLYYKSTAACRREELRHIVNYPFMSHPFCIWCLYWEFFIFWVYLYLFVSYTVRSFYSFDEMDILYMNCARIAGDSVLLLDMIHLFFRGYYDTEKSRTVMKQSEVVKKYLLTYFFVDLISSVPSYVFILGIVGKFTIPRKISMCVQLIGVLRMLRIGRWLDTLELFRQYMNFSSYLFKGIKAVLMYMIMMAFFIAMITTLINAIDVFYLERTSTHNSHKMLFSAILVLLVVSHGDSLPDNAASVTVAAIFICVGFIMNLFLCAQILQVWNKFSSARDTNENLLRQFKEYMKYKGLPASLRRRIYTYFQFKYHNEFYSEAQINSMISDQLKKEILKHVTKEHIERSKLFKNLPEPVMLAMISRLKSVIYLPDDVIVTAGKKGRTMFFIYYGTVAVYTAMGREVYHLEDGDNFGEMALVFNESATATVVAVTPCELFRLRRMDFLAVIDAYPDLKDKFMTTISNTSKSFCGHQQNNKIIMTVFDDHDCKLQHDVEESIVNQIIDTGIFINIRRKLCELATINKVHPQTQLYYKSTAACRREELRHIVNYPLMSHPFCIWCLYWEFFIFWVYLYLFVCYTVRSFYAFDEMDILYMNCARIAGDSVLLLDMIHLFFRGYYDTEKSRTIMKQSEVAKKYLLTYFFIDLLASVPSYVFFVSIVGRTKIPRNVLMFVQIIGLLRILRIGRWLDSLELFRQYMNYSSYLFKGIKAVLVYIILMASFIAIITTMMNAIDILHSERTSKRDTHKMLYSSILVLLVVSHGVHLPDNAASVTVAALFLCVGFIMNLFLCAQILQVWKKFSSARDTNENLLRQFKEYMKYKGLPASLRRRIYTYFQFKYHNEFYSEAQINSIISDHLRKEILKHVTKEHMERSKLFKNLPEPVILAMISRLRSVIYLPDDVIVTAGKKGQTMFFIYYGTVAVYTAMGREVYHLEDGDNFGEMALVFNETATATVVAVTPCELFRLRRIDFLAVIDSYPDLKDKVIFDSRNRLLKHRNDYY